MTTDAAAPPAGAPPTGAPPAGAAPTPAKTTKVRKKTRFLLCAVQLDKEGNITSVDGIVPTPSNVKKDKPRRDEFERGVKAALENGDQIKDYNGKTLVVLSFTETFRYTAEVEEIKVRKVKLTKS